MRATIRRVDRAHAQRVLSQLHARGNFHRIAREWFYDDPPATGLGEQEAEFYGRKVAG